MITATQVYLISMLDSINSLFFLLSLLSIFIYAAWGVVTIESNHANSKKDILKYLVYPFLIPLFFLILTTLIPSTKTGWQMLIVPKLAEYAQTGKALDDINKIIEKIKK